MRVSIGNSCEQTSRSCGEVPCVFSDLPFPHRTISRFCERYVFSTSTCMSRAVGYSNFHHRMRILQSVLRKVRWPTSTPKTSTYATMAQVEPSNTVQATNPAKRVKLTGRAFYESIGSPKMIVAPMVDRSEFVSPSLTPRAKHLPS